MIVYLNCTLNRSGDLNSNCLPVQWHFFSALLGFCILPSLRRIKFSISQRTVQVWRGGIPFLNRFGSRLSSSILDRLVFVSSFSKLQIALTVSSPVLVVEIDLWYSVLSVIFAKQRMVQCISIFQKARATIGKDKQEHYTKLLQEYQ